MYFFGGRNNTRRNGVGGNLRDITTTIACRNGSVCFDRNTFGESKNSMRGLDTFYELVTADIMKAISQYRLGDMWLWPTGFEFTFASGESFYADSNECCGYGVFLTRIEDIDEDIFDAILIDVTSAVSFRVSKELGAVLNESTIKECELLWMRITSACMQTDIPQASC